MKSIERQNRGIVLLIVLGILGLMSVMAVSFIQMSRLERAISTNYVDRTRAQMAGESGLEFTIARLSGLNLIPTDDQQKDLAYKENDILPGLFHADIPCFAMEHPDGSGALISGVIGNSYREGSEYYKIKIIDESGRLNINDSDGLWNIDTDPLPDIEGSDPDEIFMKPRLTHMIEVLCGILFPSDPGLAGLIAIKTAEFKDNLPGNRFDSIEQFRTLMVDNSIMSEEEVDILAEHITTNSWQDRNVIRPTFKLNISAPGTQPSDVFNIYLYSDFQTDYFELEPRSPININATSLELIETLIEPIQGWYLYEGAPSSLLSGAVGAWVVAQRHSGKNYNDMVRHNGYTQGTLSPYEGGYNAKQNEDGDWVLGNATRYGEARLTGDLATSNIAAILAARIYERIHGPNPGDDFEWKNTIDNPFKTWDEFHRFIYSQVDTEAQITNDQLANSVYIGFESMHPLDADLTGDLEAQRTPYRLSADSSFVPEFKSIFGFTRYMADAILANFNPNSRLNDHNPDAHIFMHVDKSQLTRYTTELSFYPTGVFQVESVGVVSGENGEVFTKARIRSVVELYEIFRQTTQEQFMAGYDVRVPESIYDVFLESNGDFPTAGSDIADGTGIIPNGGFWGPSLTTYPEPIRNPGSLSMENNPNNADWFSKYEGYMMLSTYQRDALSWEDLSGRAPQFLATMGYRKTSESPEQWKRRSLGVGGMMPTRYGFNTESSLDNIDSMNIAGGRGTVLTWSQDYTAPVADYSGPVWDSILLAYPDYPVGVPPEFLPMIEALLMDAPATSDNIPQPFSWVHNEPWIDYTNWASAGQANGDHFWDGQFINLILPLNTTLTRPGWNTPSDMPTTPNVEGGMVQGNLFPDGVFSETGRLLSYPSGNLGGSFGTQGSVGFWFKPNFDTGFSNRVRQLFSMGDLTMGYTHALDLMYFPISRRDPFISTAFPTHTQPAEASRANAPLMGVGRIPGHDPWPVPTHSIMCGWINSHWIPNLYGGPFLQDSSVKFTDTSTDFFPRRNLPERVDHDQLGFYGHQWNTAFLSYSAPRMLLNNGSISNIVNYAINGVPITTLLRDESYHPARSDMLAPPAFDWWWEEGPTYHLFWGYTPTPKNLQMGEQYMRFGWQSENSGPVGDSTYDDIVTWQGMVSPNVMREMFDVGRYCGFNLADPLGAAEPNLSASGVFTSAPINVQKDLRLQGQSLRLKSVMWTVYWPRYNWRPQAFAGGGDSNLDHLQWNSHFNFSGLEGVDVSQGGDGWQDPVTGQTDAITVDIMNSSQQWHISGDNQNDPAHTSIFQNASDLISHGTGSEQLFEQFTLKPNDEFRYRIYFHTDPTERLMESPVLDDITFVFVTTKPRILSYQLIQE